MMYAVDGVPASIRALPEIVPAVGPNESFHARGIRRGSDIVKPRRMGARARAVLIGRAYAYGLAAAGQAGVTRAIETLRDDLERTPSAAWLRIRWQLELNFHISCVVTCFDRVFGNDIKTA